MPVEKTPRAIIEILDAERKIVGYEIEYHMVFNPAEGEEEMAKMFQPRVIREEATPEEVAALRGASDAGLTAALHDVAQKNAGLQEIATRAVEERIAAVNDADAACSRMAAERDEALSKLAAARKALE